MQNERDSQRDSHSAFFAERNWDRVATFWSDMMLQSILPPFVQGDSGSDSGSAGYGLTDVDAIHAIGREEFNSDNPRFKRQTFALRIGYNGAAYNGYQRQKGQLVSNSRPALLYHRIIPCYKQGRPNFR
jgi:hypothetical protein